MMFWDLSENGRARVLRFHDLPEDVRLRVLRQKADDLLDAWLDSYGFGDELMLMADKMMRADKEGK